MQARVLDLGDLDPVDLDLGDLDLVDLDLGDLDPVDLGLEALADPAGLEALEASSYW